MKKVLRINPRTHLLCVPGEMVEEGMIGDVDAYIETVAMVVVKPGACLSDVKSSLETIIKDLELRERLEKTDTNTNQAE
jgi:hypothetical protein